MGDAIGELSNLLAGEVKVELDGIGVKTNISLPQVFRGPAIEILRLPHVPCKALLFETSSRPFLVAIAATGLEAISKPVGAITDRDRRAVARF